MIRSDVLDRLAEGISVPDLLEIANNRIREQAEQILIAGKRHQALIERNHDLTQQITEQAALNRALTKQLGNQAVTSNEQDRLIDDLVNQVETKNLIIADLKEKTGF